MQNCTDKQQSNESCLVIIMKAFSVITEMFANARALRENIA